ncbi:MAG: response regulator [Nitrospira sp.]|nr:MAG: response regulator [Nitrospira sp.]
MVDTPEAISADILIVEDDAQVRAMLRQMLEVAGFRVREAINGKEAMKSWKADQPDLVITDVLMPEMDGFEVITSLRKLDPQSKVIAITGGGPRS